MTLLYIFDMGGVLVRSHSVVPRIAEYLQLSRETLHDLAYDMFHPLMEGKITTTEFWRIFSERAGQVIEEELFTKFFDPVRIEPVYALIEHLKTQHRVICGTNTIPEHYAIHQERGDYAIFDTVYASHLMGCSKPSPDFYRWILDREGIASAQTVFIDDSLANIESARKLGIPSIHFTGSDALIAALRSL